MFDDESFAELFPAPQNNPLPQLATETSPSSILAPVSSLFEETSNAPSLFNALDNSPVSASKDTTIEQWPQQTNQDKPQTSESVASDDLLGNDDLIDDLDFIDDSEFMAAFGASTANTPATQAVPTQSDNQLNGTRQTQPNRYIPQVPVQPPRNPITPQQTSVQPQQTQYTPQAAAQIGATPSQPTRSVSSRYVPSTAPQPSVGTAPKPQSPQGQTTRQTWNQQSTAPRPPPPSQIPSSMSSSFVTAKGGYSSPYDLPPQIAIKPKRHIPPPIPTHKQSPVADVRPPLSGSIRPSSSTVPPPRASSAQPHFPPPRQLPDPGAQPQFSPQQQYMSPLGAQVQPQCAPPKVASSPLRSQSIPGPNQYDARKGVPPLTQQAPNDLGQSMYAAPRDRQMSGSMYAPRRVISPPMPQAPHEGQMSQSMYAPRREFSPPLQQSSRESRLPAPSTYTPGQVGAPMQHGAHHYPAPGRVVSPAVPARDAQFQRVPAIQAPPRAASPPIQALPSSRYAPGQRLVPPKSASAQNPKSPVPSTSQRRSSEQITHQYGQSQGFSPPSHQQYPSQHQHEYITPPQAQHPHRTMQMNHPLHSSPSDLAPHSRQQYQNQPPFPTQQGNFYPQPLPEPSIYEDDPHADLPPHFKMESGEYSDVYDPEGLGPPPMQFPDRNVMGTPEPMDDHQPDLFNDVSPPRPWERTVNEENYSTPPKTRSFSPYDPRGSVSVAPPPIPQSIIERQGSISPQVRVSPRKDSTTDRSQSYPSRKAPPHVRAMTAPPVPRTLEEDFHFRRGGCPIVNFGFGGRMITMIPRTPHRVNIRGTAPMAVPGMITFSNLREIIELPALASSFPGPLYSANKPVKGKGKDIGKWLDDNLVMFEKLRGLPNLEEEDIHQIEDRKILYRLVKLLVDNNGVLDGK